MVLQWADRIYRVAPDLPDLQPIPVSDGSGILNIYVEEEQRHAPLCPRTKVGMRCHCQAALFYWPMYLARINTRDFTTADDALSCRATSNFAYLPL